MADEVPAESVAVDGVFRLEVLRTVLSDDLDPGLDEDGHVLHGDVLRRGNDRHSVADLDTDLLVALANLVRRHARAPLARLAASRRDGVRRGARGCTPCRDRSVRPARYPRHGARVRLPATDRAFA